MRKLKDEQKQKRIERSERAKRKKVMRGRNNLAVLLTTTRAEDLIAGRNSDGAIGFREGRHRSLEKKEEEA